MDGSGPIGLRKRGIDRKSRGGFSLVEVAVTIFAIAVLLSFLIPALGKSRAAARQAIGLARVRELTSLVHLYATSSSDLAPIADSNSFYPSVVNLGSMQQQGHWQAIEQWSGVLLSSGVITMDEAGLFRSPGAHDEFAHSGGDFTLSASFAGPSLLWTKQRALLDIDRATIETGQRLSDAVHASRKALLWDSAAGALAWSPSRVPRNDQRDIELTVPIAMTDGSASVRSPSSASRPFETQIVPIPIRSMRLHNTPSGVAGIDYPSF